MRRLWFSGLVLLLSLLVPIVYFSDSKKISYGDYISTNLLSSNETFVSVGTSTIYFTGDVMLARKVERWMDWEGSYYPLSRLSIPDDNFYLVGNFEAAVPDVHVPTPYFTYAFSVPTTSLFALTDFGFTHFSLANNHSYDFGAAGFLNTAEELNENNIVTFGDVLVGSSSVSYLELGTTTVAVLGLYAVNQELPWADIELLMNAVNLESDKQIAYIHWGEEYEKKHSVFQERTASKLVELGMDLIVGHHPHVVQDIEMVGGTPVFYSLGNFVFDQYFDKEVQEGLLLRLVKDNTFRLELLPVTSVDKQSSPRYMNNEEKLRWLNEWSNVVPDDLESAVKQGYFEIWGG